MTLFTPDSGLKLLFDFLILGFASWCIASFIARYQMRRQKDASYTAHVTRNRFAYLMAFVLVVIGHWGEHLVMAYQFYVQRLPMSKCLGILGYFYPEIVRNETLHYGFAIVMLIGLWILRHQFTGKALYYWLLAYNLQFWHHFEHLLLVTQALSHHYLTHMPMPMSIAQLWFPRMQLHLYYNTIVTIPMVLAMYFAYGKRMERVLARLRSKIAEHNRIAAERRLREDIADLHI